MADTDTTPESSEDPYLGPYLGVHPDKIRQRIKEAHDLYRVLLPDNPEMAAIALVAREVAGLTLATIFQSRQIGQINTQIDDLADSELIPSASIIADQLQVIGNFMTRNNPEYRKGNE